MPLSGSSSTSDRLPGEHQLPGLACIFTAPDTSIYTGQRGVDDYLAFRRQLGINDDLVHRRSDEFTVTAGRVDGKVITTGINVIRAVEKVPGGTTV